MAFLIVVVGLGNPEKEYENTRHNAGFMALDAMASNFQFSMFNVQSKLNAQISEGAIENKKVILAKPQTFMNNSGSAVKSLYARYKIQDTRYIVVVHDDIDLPLGTVKVSTNRGSAGHKGVESIINALGTKNFTRIRIGIQPSTGKPENVESFVLKKFTKEERKILKSIMESISNTIEKAMSQFNK